MVSETQRVCRALRPVSVEEGILWIHPEVRSDVVSSQFFSEVEKPGCCRSSPCNGEERGEGYSSQHPVSYLQSTWHAKGDQSWIPESEVDVLVPSPLWCFNFNKFGHTSQRCKTTAKCHRCRKDKHEEQCNRPQICPNCNGPHAASAKDCLVWREEKEEKERWQDSTHSRRKTHLLPEAWQLVEEKSSSSGFTSSLSFADMVNKKESVKSVVCQTDLTWVSSDAPVQTVRSVVYVSGGQG